MTSPHPARSWLTRHPRLCLLALSGVFCAGIILLAEIAARAYYSEWAPPKDWEKFWSFDGRLGWSHVPGSRGRFDQRDFSVAVQISSQGLRDDEYPIERTGKKRILVLGDSYGWGWGIEQDERFSEILERLHPDWEVINASVVGYGTVQELLYLRERGMAFHPDVVLLLLCGNDLTDNLDGGSWYSRPHASVDQQELKIHNLPVPRPTWVQELGKLLRTRSCLGVKLFAAREALRRGFRSQTPSTEGAVAAQAPSTSPQRAVMGRLLSGMQDTCQQGGSRLVVVSIPMIEEQRTSLQEALASAGVLYLPLDGDFKSSGSNTSFAHDFHWNAKGHKIAADAIDAFLQGHGVLTTVAAGS
jgi:hypothetical protein